VERETKVTHILSIRELAPALLMPPSESATQRRNTRPVRRHRGRGAYFADINETEDKLRGV
jgi:hypothetical protein